MGKESKLFALACHVCEATKREEDVLWELDYDGEDRNIQVGFLTGADLKKHSQEGRVYKTKSSSICPPCMVTLLNSAQILENPSLESLRQHYVVNEAEHSQEIAEGIVRSIDLYVKFKQQKEGCNNE